jgi:hypothetical protein
VQRRSDAGGSRERGDRRPSRDRDDRSTNRDRGERRPYRDGGERRPYSDGGERRPFRDNGERRPSRDGGERRPFREGGERRPYRDGGERRPQAQGGERRPYRDGGQRRPQHDGDRRPNRDGGDRAERRPYREGGKPYREGIRPFRDTDGRSRSAASGERGHRGDAKPGQRDRRDSFRARGGSQGRSRGERDDKLWTRDGRPARGDRGARDEWRHRTEEEERAAQLRSVRPRHDDPEIPADVQANELDRVARNELKTLSKDNGDWVAKHLVMASRLIESDPQQAHRHALSASRRAGRIAIVRETLAITSYATGDFALALRELRTYRRISGKDDQLPLMVDSERGVGRPDRALELGRSVDRSTLPADVRVALAIAMSGARLDLGQADAALAELEIPQLDPTRAFAYSPGLFHAYAEVLDELGRSADAETWRNRAIVAEEALAEAADDGSAETIDIIEEELPNDHGAVHEDD